MLRYIFIFVLAVATALNVAAKGDDLLKFEETTYDFGTIKESDQPVVHEYEFVNTADEPVAVLSVSTECGCTHPEYPVKPLAPGEKGKIKVTFTPAGQGGEVNKDIKVRYRGAKAPASKRLTLRLRGTVAP